ncbi:unnamed protein product [Timema podura]|uniref:Uncharacterized protein n=1 Tax=Timema podura TaxID=61482 RepID=A0ABN7NSY2_TIMPD|nr:unnamed protein product [Timema podura]
MRKLGAEPGISSTDSPTRLTALKLGASRRLLGVRRKDTSLGHSTGTRGSSCSPAERREVVLEFFLAFVPVLQRYGPPHHHQLVLWYRATEGRQSTRDVTRSPSSRPNSGHIILFHILARPLVTPFFGSTGGEFASSYSGSNRAGFETGVDTNLDQYGMDYETDPFLLICVGVILYLAPPLRRTNSDYETDPFRSDLCWCRPPLENNFREVNSTEQRTRLERVSCKPHCVPDQHLKRNL